VIDYHSSGGYDAELEDVITNAQLYAAMMPTPKNQTAWVFDIDETTLSGYEQMKSIGFGYVAKINHDWVMTSSAPAIPQSLAFYQQLVKAGFKIIFLTGRKDDEHDATALNLEKQGYNTYDMLITRTPPGQSQCSATAAAAAAGRGLQRWAAGQRCKPRQVKLGQPLLTRRRTILIVRTEICRVQSDGVGLQERAPHSVRRAAGLRHRRMRRRSVLRYGRALHGI